MDEVEFLRESLEIPSISGSEEAFSQFLIDQMIELGFSVSQDHVGNVIGEIGEGEPVLLLSSHMDTVVGAIQIKLENGKLYGRGAVDAKGSLIAMVCAAARFVGKKIPGKIVVGGIVEEETTLKGINTLIDTVKKVDYAIFGEPSGINRICIASKGRVHLHLTVKTITGQAHVSTLESGENPIHLIINFWNQLREKMSESPFLGKTRFFSVEPNITLLKGGTATNILPDACEIDIDIRFPSGIHSSLIVKEIDNIAIKLLETSNAEIQYDILSQIEGFRADKNSEIAGALKKAIEDITGTEAKFLRKSGTNFMAILGKELQIPVISYGPGDSHLDHTPNEHIDVKEYLKSIDVLERFISMIFSDSTGQ